MWPSDQLPELSETEIHWISSDIHGNAKYHKQKYYKKICIYFVKPPNDVHAQDACLYVLILHFSQWIGNKERDINSGSCDRVGLWVQRQELRKRWHAGMRLK